MNNNNQETCQVTLEFSKVNLKANNCETTISSF